MIALQQAMKISDIAEKNGFNYHEFETFCRTTAGIKVKGTFSSNIDDNDVNRVISMFQDNAKESTESERL
jgi:hypothetical protein